MKTVVLILLLVPCLGFAQNDNFNISQIYPIEKSHSYLGFSIKYMGYAKVRGRFENFNGSFRYNPNNIEKTSVSFSVNVASIDTDLDFRDKDLRSENWFNVEKFPKIFFSSSNAQETKDGLLLKGKLIIKDISKEVIVFRSCAFHTGSTTLLRFVSVHGHSLNITLMSDSNDYIFLFN